MKKLLTILGSLGLVATTAATVVACSAPAGYNASITIKETQTFNSIYIWDKDKIENPTGNGFLDGYTGDTVKNLVVRNFFAAANWSVMPMSPKANMMTYESKGSIDDYLGCQQIPTGAYEWGTIHIKPSTNTSFSAMPYKGDIDVFLVDGSCVSDLSSIASGGLDAQTAANNLSSLFNVTVTGTSISIDGDKPFNYLDENFQALDKTEYKMNNKNYDEFSEEEKALADAAALVINAEDMKAAEDSTSRTEVIKKLILGLQSQGTDGYLKAVSVADLAIMDWTLPENGNAGGFTLQFRQSTSLYKGTLKIIIEDTTK